MTNSASRPQVLIAGGGPVGLALAVELGWRGVRCLLIERGDGAITQPKMNEVNTRTMEICRRWGIADRILNCPFPGDFPLDAAFVTSLFGYELGRVERPARNHQTPEPHSPYRLQACSQYWFDPILQTAARNFPSVTLRYHCQLESFAQDVHGVTAQVVDTRNGHRETLQADYLVGCDGAASDVRSALAIEMTGQGTVGYPIHMFFRAPNLMQACGRRPATFFMLTDRDGMWGNLRIIDPAKGIWRLMVDKTDGSLTPETVDREALLQRAFGRPFEVEWMGVNIWHRRSLVAERYGRGRVFLAGDAVHLLSPTGALGMNSGVGDAVDLGWKLAAVLAGWGSDGLLESYDLERRPVGLRNVRMATTFYMNNEGFGQIGIDLEVDDEATERERRQIGSRLEHDIGREFRTVGAQLGYRYDPSPICVEDHTPAPPDEPAEYVPSARPGSRAPHCWIAEGRSTLDLFGRGFVLLRFPDAPAASEFAVAASQRGIPFEEVDINSADVARLYERKLVLVRPDGHVVWRSDALPDDAGHVLDRLRGAHILGWRAFHRLKRVP